MPLSAFLAGAWDPVLIVGQIVLMQSLFYATFGVLVATLDMLSFSRLALVQLFAADEIGVTFVSGWMTLLALLLTCVATAAFMMLVVERAKKCIDFTATLFGVHLLLCCAVAGFPTGATWWVSFVVFLIATDLLAEFLCMRRELRAIPRTSSLFSAAAAAAAPGASAPSMSASSSSPPLPPPPPPPPPHSLPHPPPHHAGASTLGAGTGIGPRSSSLLSPAVDARPLLHGDERASDAPSPSTSVAMPPLPPMFPGSRAGAARRSLLPV